MGSLDTASAPTLRTLLWGALLLLLGARPAAARGFEPWLEPAPLHERVGLAGQRGATAQEIEKAEVQLSWCLTALGETHPSTAQAQAQLGLLLLQSGAAERAEPALRGALDRLRQLPKDAEQRTRLRALLGLGAALDLTGRSEEAQQLGAEAIALRRHLGDSEPAGPLDVMLGLLYLRGGAPAQAEAVLRPLAQAAPLAVGKDARRAAALHELWAEALWQLGRSEQAEAEQRRVLQHLEQAAQAEAAQAERQALQGDLAAAQANLAIWLDRLGRDGDAEGLLARAASGAARLPAERQGLAPLLQRDLAAHHWLAGQPSRAEAPLQAAAQALGDGPAQQLWTGALQAEIAPGGARAAAALRKAAASAGETGLLGQEQLAQLLRRTGHLDEAATIAIALHEARQRALPGAEPRVLRAALLRAAIASERGQAEAAEELLRKALSGAAGPGAPPAASPLLALLRGRLAQSLLGHPGAAGPPPADLAQRRAQGAQLLAQALEGSAALAQRAAVLQSPWLRAALKMGYSSLIGALLPPDPPEGGQALQPELVTALLRAADAMASGDEYAAELRALRDRGDATAEQLLPLLRQRAAALLLPRPQQLDRGPAPTAEQLQPLEAAVQGAEAQLLRRSAALQRALRRRDLSAEQLEAQLAARLGSLVVLLRAQGRGAPRASQPLAFLRGGIPLPPLRGPSAQPEPTPGEPRDHYAALVLRHGEAARLVDLGEAARIDGGAERLAQLTSEGRDPTPELRLLGQLLAQPLLPLLPATGRLYVIAPPELLAVPVAALPVGGGLLCSRGPVHVLAGLSEVLEPPPPPPPAPDREPLQRLLLLGAPLLREPLPYLPRVYPTQLAHGEMGEVNLVLRQHRYDPRGGPVSGLAATKTRLRAWLPSRVVHLLAPLAVVADGPAAAAAERAASQLRQRAFSMPLGELAPPKPILPVPGRAGLALAGIYQDPMGEPGQPGYVPARSDDGFLGPEEVAQLDLRSTALLVLSGPVLQPTLRGAGAALAQLGQAAQAAGAAEVVMTLWRAPEPAAKELMGQLYRAWLRSGDASEAVREVQLAMHAKGAPPIGWAGLRVIGRR